MAHDEHPAVIASRMSPRLAGDKNREAWLALYHDDAFIQDPVGVSPLDPTGKGHIGKAAVTAFYDAVIANTDMDFRVLKSFPRGDECANVADIHFAEESGGFSDQPGTRLITHYKVDPAGKILFMRAYWHFDPTVEVHDRPAHVAAEASRRAAEAGDREAWLALFADDAIVEDPVAPSSAEAGDTGYRGRDAIAAFWDQAIAGSQPSFTVHRTYVCANECACFMTLDQRRQDGSRDESERVVIYRVDEDGRIDSLRVFPAY